MTRHILIDESTEGKRVIDGAGEDVGMVSEVRGGTAFVNPDPSITETLMSKLGWDIADEDDYPLRSDDVERVTDEEVHLRRNI